MHLTRLLLTLTTVVTLAGCSSTPTHVDEGPIRAQTFSFIDPGQRPTPSFADSRAAAHTMIQEAITGNLSSRGLKRVPSGGEVTVAYLIITGNNVSTTAIEDHFGYGRDAATLQKKAHEAYTGSKNPNAFEAGTLVVDVIDSRTFKVLWRGHITRPLLGNLPAEQRPERVQEYVDTLLGELRLATR